VVTIAIFAGDITETDTCAVCTSTNPRLTLVMGTGAAVRGRGGFSILRACEQIVAREGPLPTGSARATNAGELRHKIAIHCVASDLSHRSSEEIIRSCVKSAATLAVEAGCDSIAVPVFGAGHARVPYARALSAVVDELRKCPLERAVIAIPDNERVEDARMMFPDLQVIWSQREPEEPARWW
jgi:O-acetyl-ADP-ribose deacetylase